MGRPFPLWPLFRRTSLSRAALPPTAPRQVGHYLGLKHTFEGGCHTVAQCSTKGDLICDTAQQETKHYVEPNSNGVCRSDLKSCGGQRDSIDNFMSYSEDPCMRSFTSEQARPRRSKSVS